MKKEQTFLVGIFLCSLVMFSVPSVAAQRSAEDIAEMVVAFDDPAILQGFISVTFADTVTKDDAESILTLYKLKFYPKRNCTTTTDPATGKDKKTCTAEDAWDDKKKTALAIVKDGREKATAQLLLEKSDLVVSVDPAFQGKNGPAPPAKKTDAGQVVGKTNDDKGSEGSQTASSGSGLGGFFSKIINWFKNLFTS